MSEPTLTDEILEHHYETSHGRCSSCENRWPCDARRAADRIAELEAKVQTLTDELYREKRRHR